MDEFDAATAFAGVEQWFFLRTLAPAYPASICIFRALPLALHVAIKGWIIHDIRAAFQPTAWTGRRLTVLHLRDVGPHS